MIFITIALGNLGLYYLWTTYTRLRRNIALAKASGLPYIISPISGMSNYFLISLEPILVPLMEKTPYFKDSLWPAVLTAHRGLYYGEKLTKQLGEVSLIVSPAQIFLHSNNAEANFTMASRRNEFLKPIELYGIVDLFGTSIMTTEGDEWKRHRKIVAPAFAEKSNMLVWKESLKQAQGMIKAWSSIEGNTVNKMTVKDAGPGTAHLALHVISGAGFGVTQLWQGEDESRLGTSVIPGFNTAKTTENHIFTFKEALHHLVNNVLWIMLLPEWLIKRSPFKLHKTLYRAHGECADYFKELADYKAGQIEKGVTTDDKTMDIMGPLVKASQNSPEDPKGQYLTKQEVIADCWLILFAGHETSANTLLYTFVFLAIDLATQSQLQSQVDSIVGQRPTSEWTYEKDMGRLYNSLVGASMSETLRVVPPVTEIPKTCRPTSQTITIEGKEYMIPNETRIHLSGTGTGRNPRYWPHSPSKVSKKSHDLDDWVPQRWLSSNKTTAKRNSPGKEEEIKKEETPDGLETVSYESTSPNSLFTPPRGAYLPFAEGARACPGRRFAQVEITAVMAAVYHDYSIELDVSDWASDGELEKMGKEEKKKVYDKAIERARRVIGESKTIIALKMFENLPLKVVKRGEERFGGIYV